MSLRPTPANKLSKLLNKIGFEILKQRGSLVILRHPDGRVTAVPVHPGEDIARGLPSKMIKDTEMTKEQFLKLLEEA